MANEKITEQSLSEMPEGDAKRDAARWLAAQKVQEAETILADAGIERADPAKLKVENEVGSAIDFQTGDVFVSKADTARFRYAWCYRDPHNEFAGVHVGRMKALGWEIVQGEMPEAWEHRHVDGTRVVADCVLLRTTLDNYRKLETMDRIKRQRQQDGAATNLYDLARECGVKVRNIEEMGEVGEAIAAKADAETAQRAQHRSAAPPRRRTIATPGIPSR